MTTPEQFWWNWAVQAAAAAGTIGAVVVALFGGWLQHVLFPARLTLAVLNPKGSETFFGNDPQRKGRFYHCRVTSERSWPAATDLRVLLVRLDIAGPEGFKTVWTGDLPMRWMHQEYFPLLRTIAKGESADCDLLCADKLGGSIRLLPLFYPNDLPAIHSRPVTFIASIQANSKEGKSPIVRIRVEWDGSWADDAAAMAQHLKLSVMDERS